MAKLDPEFRTTLEAAFKHAVSHLENLEQTSVAATADLGTLRARINKPLARAGIAPDQVIHDLAADVAGGLLGSAGGRFFGWDVRCADDSNSFQQRVSRFIRARGALAWIWAIASQTSARR